MYSTGLTDFTPEVVQAPDMIKSGKFEDFNNLATRIAHWIPANQVCTCKSKRELRLQRLNLSNYNPLVQANEVKLFYINQINQTFCSNVSVLVDHMWTLRSHVLQTSFFLHVRV